MTRKQKEQAMREIVRDLGKVQKYFNGRTGEISRVVKMLIVPIALYEGDTCTEVELDEHGQLEITGWDGQDGLGDYADKFKDEEIDKLYTAMLKMAA